GFEGGGAPPDLREALLEHFLAQRPVAHDPDDRCEHDTAVLAEEELERGIVALADPTQQVPAAIRSGIAVRDLVGGGRHATSITCVGLGAGADAPVRATTTAGRP